MKYRYGSSDTRAFANAVGAVWRLKMLETGYLPSMIFTTCLLFQTVPSLSTTEDDTPVGSSNWKLVTSACDALSEKNRKTNVFIPLFSSGSSSRLIVSSSSSDCFDSGIFFHNFFVFVTVITVIMTQILKSSKSLKRCLFGDSTRHRCLHV